MRCSPLPDATHDPPIRVPVKRHRGEPGHTRDTHGTHGRTRAHGSHRQTSQPSKPNDTPARPRDGTVQTPTGTETVLEDISIDRVAASSDLPGTGRSQAGGSSCSDDGGGPARSSQRVPTSPTASVVACASPCHRRLRGHQQCIWHPTHRQTSARIHAPASTATWLATQPSTRAPSAAVLHALALGVTR